MPQAQQSAMTLRGSRWHRKNGTQQVCAGFGVAVRVLIIISCSVISGCAAIVGDAAYSAAFRIKIEDVSKLSQDQVQEVINIQPIGPAEGLRYVSKGKMSGLACKLSVAPLVPIWTWRPPLSDINGKTPEEAAMRQLKLKTFNAGGNALLSSSCTHNESLDWTNNCFETWICTGEVIHVDAKCLNEPCKQ